MWKKIVDSADLMIYEKKYKDFDVKIEARQSDEDGWEIFKKYTGDSDLSYVEQFIAKNEDELNFLVKRLMKKSFSAKQIEQIKLKRSRVPRLHLKRDFKEYCMEKWIFTVDSDKDQNLVFIKFDEVTGLDIIIHEKYRPIEDKIIAEIDHTFNLDHENDDIEVNIFYYSKHTQKSAPEQEKNLIIGKLEIGFDE